MSGVAARLAPPLTPPRLAFGPLFAVTLLAMLSVGAGSLRTGCELSFLVAAASALAAAGLAILLGRRIGHFAPAAPRTVAVVE